MNCNNNKLNLLPLSPYVEMHDWLLYLSILSSKYDFPVYFENSHDVGFSGFLRSSDVGVPSVVKILVIVLRIIG